jgi:hypothetical protein
VGHGITFVPRDRREALIEDADRPSLLDVFTTLAEQEGQDDARQKASTPEVLTCP